MHLKIDPVFIPKFISLLVFSCAALNAIAQHQWQNVDTAFGPLPSGIHVYRSTDPIDGKPSIAYYVRIDLANKARIVSARVGNGKRYTPTQYFEQESVKPVIVMNTTFFEFEHNSNLNIVMRDGQMLAYQQHSLPGRGKDTLTYRHPFGSAIGIDKRKRIDIAWLYTDSARSIPYASQQPIPFFKDSIAKHSAAAMLEKGQFRKWKMQTAFGGGPVLLQDGQILITNNEEIKFAGKAIDDKHPRTAIGYTADRQLILLVVEGRFPGKAEGATLKQEAQLLKEIGCIEAMNLDGGGSSCLLINGKPTITPSDKGAQRPVPAVLVGF